MKKALLLLLVMAAFMGTVVAQSDFSDDSMMYGDHSDKAKCFDKCDQKHDDKCRYDDFGKKCWDKYCEKCSLFVKCEKCGEEHRCDCKCDQCGEKCHIYEFCPSCGAQYACEMADGYCDRCGKECNWFKKCDKCGSEHYFDGHCDKCGGKCHYDKCEKQDCDTCKGKSEMHDGYMEPRAPVYAYFSVN